MNELQYDWGSPNKDIPIGTLVRFVSAPPRFKGEEWRDPGSNLMGETAIVLSEAQDDSHNWGGRFRLHSPERGYIAHYGDFLEPT